MKAITRSIWIAAALCGGILLPGCSETPSEQAADTSDTMQKIADDAAESNAKTIAEWENQRNAILGDLRAQRDAIDKDLGTCNEALAKKDLKAGDRTEKEAMKVELEREKGIVDEAITGIEGIGAETAPADRETMRVKAEKVRDDVQTWWDKVKEEQDKHTEADYDHDGH